MNCKLSCWFIWVWNLASHIKRITEAKGVNPLMPNDPYRGRTAPLTSKVAFYIFIQQI